MPTATNGAAPASDAVATRPVPQLRIVRPVPIVLDKPRTLRMDFDAMARFEEATGESAWYGNVWSSPKYLRQLIWAALLHEDPDLTLDEVLSWRDLFQIANMAYLTTCLGELWGETMPDADQPASDTGSEGDADPNPPKRRAG